MAWVAALAALASAGAGAYSSNQASKAAKQGSKDATQAQINSLLALLQMNEPQRAMGYQAMGDLSSLYGYDMAPYTPYAQLASTVTGGGGGAGGIGSAGGLPGKGGSSLPWYLGGNDTLNLSKFTGIKPPLEAAWDKVFGGGTKPYWQNKDGTITFNGAEGGKKFYGGTIDPRTGTVTLNNDPDGMQAALQDYLRTGQGELPNEAARFLKAVEAMKGSGWSWDNVQNANWTPGGGPIKPNGAAGEYAYADGVVPTSGATQPTSGNFGRFFTSPDYQFRQQEGVKALDRGAAARGGVLSGNRLRAGTELSSNLAAGEYGNYFNRLMAMVTGTQAATNNNSNAVMSTGGNLAQLAQDSGVARASGIMGMGNSIMNGINSGVNAYYLNKYLGK